MAMKQPTELDMLSWPKPNYVNPETRGPLLIGFEVSFTLAAVIVVAARLICPRYTNYRVLGVDDWLMALATALLVAITAVNCYATKHGVGSHAWDFRPEWLDTTGWTSILEQAVYGPLVSITKVSILLFYRRIFRDRFMRLLIWAGVVACSAFGVSFGFACLFQCIPIKSYWLMQLPGRRCVNQTALVICASVFNTLLDIFVFSLPLRSVMHLRMPRAQRLGLALVFALGLIVCVVGALRIWYATVYFASYDSAYNGAIMCILLVLECSIGIIGGSLPTIRPLLAHIFPRLMRSGGLGTSSGTGVSGNRRGAATGSRLYGLDGGGGGTSGGGGGAGGTIGGSSRASKGIGFSKGFGEYYHYKSGCGAGSKSMGDDDDDDDIKAHMYMHHGRDRRGPGSNPTGSGDDVVLLAMDAKGQVLDDHDGHMAKGRDVSIVETRSVSSGSGAGDLDRDEHERSPRANDLARSADVEAAAMDRAQHQLPHPHQSHQHHHKPSPSISRARLSPSPSPSAAPLSSLGGIHRSVSVTVAFANREPVDG